jgi:hypothetical protein
VASLLLLLSSSIMRLTNKWKGQACPALCEINMLRYSVDTDLGHTPIRASTLEVTHELVCSKDIVNQWNWPVSRLGWLDTHSLSGRLLNTSREEPSGRGTMRLS